MKNISEAGLPYSFHYQIHSHNGLNGSEREAHVHIYSHKRGVAVKYRIEDPIKQIEGNKLPPSDSKAIEAWVFTNRFALRTEWDAASDPYGGRN